MTKFAIVGLLMCCGVVFAESTPRVYREGTMEYSLKVSRMQPGDPAQITVKLSTSNDSVDAFLVIIRFYNEKTQRLTIPRNEDGFPSHHTAWLLYNDIVSITFRELAAISTSDYPTSR